MSEANPVASDESADIPPKADAHRIVLFDLDGTLSDPARGIVASLRLGFEAVGLDPDAHAPLERFIGPPLQETFAEAGLDRAGVDQAIEAFRERYGMGGLFENDLYPDTVAMLDRFANAGWRIGVATSKPEPFADRILAHFEIRDRFAVLAGATMDGTRRAKRDVIAHALAQFDQPGDASIAMVGDRAVDINGGQSFGLTTIGAVWGYAPVEELIAAEPSALAGSPLEVADLLGT